jgi:fimbrial isopeptide formation D2 family protein/uncharacterized repeat protein (TIGR01451 family)
MRRKNNAVVLALFMSVLMIVPICGVALNVKENVWVSPLVISGTGFDIDVEKKVWDGCNWVEEVYAGFCTIVRFNITVHNSGTCNLSNVTVVDTLPDSLAYADNATVNGVPEEPLVNGSNLTWFFTGDLEPSCRIYIEFDAHVIVDEPGSVDVNWAEATGVAPDAETVSDRDSAKVIVPGMLCEKKVWDPSEGEWVEEFVALKGQIVKFKITVRYYGGFYLYNIKVKDTLPCNLKYADGANPSETYVSADGKLVWWNLTRVLSDGESVAITFLATVVDYGGGVNVANVTADECSGETWYGEDTATVITEEGMTIEKKVLDNGEWREETTAAVGETVRFRITIYYYGRWTLYNIKVRDELPKGLEYAGGATHVETGVSGDKRTVWWNLTVELSDGESTSVEFDALITGDVCGILINVANVTANECSGLIIYGKDNASVNAVCPLVADAGGPYFGNIDGVIKLEGDATGGAPPYTYAWDLDNDGTFDDASGKTPTVDVNDFWSKPGDYTIWLKVTDKDANEDTDYATVTIGGNNPPNKPDKPSGPTQGRAGTSYSYTTSTTDPDGDQVYYKWDWGDGTFSEWIGPLDSGETVTASHIWATMGTYRVRVKAKDVYDQESDWAELEVTMPKTCFAIYIFERINMWLIQMLERTGMFI